MRLTQALSAARATPAPNTSTTYPHRTRNRCGTRTRQNRPRNRSHHRTSNRQSAKKQVAENFPNPSPWLRCLDVVVEWWAVRTVVRSASRVLEDSRETRGPASLLASSIREQNLTNPRMVFRRFSRDSPKTRESRETRGPARSTASGACTSALPRHEAHQLLPPSEHL